MRIISSVGPSCKSAYELKKIHEAGCNSFRFNTSHMNEDEVRSQVEYLKNIYNSEVIVDLRGHKIRVSRLLNSIFLSENDEVCICSEKFYRENKNSIKTKLIPVNIDFDFDYLKECKTAFLKDGAIKLIFKDIIEQGAILYKVNGEGKVSMNNGINFPTLDRSELLLTERDKEDMIFALENKADIIFLSYIVNSKMVKDARKHLESLIKNNPQYAMPKIYSKIESIQGINNLNDILKNSDGIVLGRGDLYLEIDIFDYTKHEDEIIKKMKNNKKELIIATHIMNTMRFNTKPSLAEVRMLQSFIDNNVSGVMLVNETSIGKEPYKFVEFINDFVNKNKVLQ